VSDVTLVIILESVSGVIVLSLLYFWLGPGLRLDLFRQNMFSVRDELFDYAAAGNIPFSHPAYRLLRRSANGFIRYAHRLTFFRILMTVAMWKVLGHHPEPKWTKDWTKSLESLDEKTRADLLLFHEQILTLVLKRLVFGSPLLIMMLSGVIVTTICNAGIKSVRSAVKSSAKNAVATLIDPELLEEEAAKAAAATA
jgi:hypothetical protein